MTCSGEPMVDLVAILAVWGTGFLIGWAWPP